MSGALWPKLRTILAAIRNSGVRTVWRSMRYLLRYARWQRIYAHHPAPLSL